MAVFATQASRITDEMFIEAARAVADKVSSDLLIKGYFIRCSRTFSRRRSNRRRAWQNWSLILGLARVSRPTDMVAFIRDYIYKPEYKLKPAPFSTTA